MMIRDWTMPLDEEDRATLAKIHRQFSQCCAKLQAADGDVDAAVKAITSDLRKITTGHLPPAARVIWAERIARPMRAEPTKPIPQRVLAGMRSWPSARMAKLIEALAAIQAILKETEEEAQHEAIYVEISRAYS